MKIYSNSNVNTININISIVFYGSIIEGAKTVPAGKLNLTPQEIMDFRDFIMDVGGLIDTFNFEIMDEHPSRYERSASYYYAFYPTNSDFIVCYNNLYFLRISTHERPSKKRNPFPKYYQDTAQELKMPKSKPGVQYHRCIEVIINNERYDDYDDAFEAMKKKFLNIQKKSDKLSGK